MFHVKHSGLGGGGRRGGSPNVSRETFLPKGEVGEGGRRMFHSETSCPKGKIGASEGRNLSGMFHVKHSAAAAVLPNPDDVGLHLPRNDL